MIVYETTTVKGFKNLGNIKHYHHYSDEIDNYENIKLYNAIYAPIFDGDGERIGVMQLYNKLDNEPFNKVDLIYLKTMTDYIG